MDDPNITMEEYIRLEEEKARRRGKLFNWETAKYGKICYDEDPTVSSLNDNEIDFRISFDESDDEDYMVFGFDFWTSLANIITPKIRLNPKVQDVVKNEIVKLLDSRLIYPDSSWVSPIHVVPKKRGMTVVLNDDNELIPSRTVTGWRDSSKFQSHPKIKKRQHSPVLMGLLLSEECLLGYATLQLPFKDA
ncbi:hypothetical protein Tco_1420532 [Tanacetum coccineum]